MIIGGRNVEIFGGLSPEDLDKFNVKRGNWDTVMLM